MEEMLYKRLVQIPHSYEDFIDGAMSYARKKPGRLKALLEYLNSNDNLTCSDVVKFIMEQPDFHEGSTVRRIKVG